MEIIDRPWAIVYGPKYAAEHGKGLMYGLGKTREDAWTNAILVMYGSHSCSLLERTKAELKREGMVARRVEVRL